MTEEKSELNKKLQEAIENAEYEEIKHSAIYKVDFNEAANECEHISIDVAVKFAEFINKEGWQEYDGYDRWICPSESTQVLETKQLFQKFINNIYGKQ